MEDTPKSHCNQCGQSTNHHIVHKEVVTGDEEIAEDFVAQWKNTSFLLKCCGCDEVSLKITKWFSAYEGEEIQYFPPRIFRKRPKWFSVLTDPFGNYHQEFADLLDEIYVCLQNNCPRSAAMTCRALLERIFISEVGDQGGFLKNIDAFEKRGNISQIQKSFLLDVLEVGHASIHRGYKPSKDDLSAIVDITESLMEILFVQKDQAAALKKKVLPRGKT